VSYNLKKLVEAGYMHHQRCQIDRRAVRVKLTEKGRNIRVIVGELFARHAEGLDEKAILDKDALKFLNVTLKSVERFWADQIRYIY